MTVSLEDEANMRLAIDLADAAVRVAASNGLPALAASLADRAEVLLKNSAPAVEAQ